MTEDDDKKLFQKHMADVKPLAPSNKKLLQKTKPLFKKPNQDKSTSPEQYFLSDFIGEPVDFDEALSYCKPSLQKKQFSALKNGQIHYEGRLDLHGMHAEPAKDALCQFIASQKRLQKRCVLIIHGKGGHHGEPPVIKNLVNRWLKQIDAVMAFHSALPKDGGKGALYVLLKRTCLDPRYDG